VVEAVFARLELLLGLGVVERRGSNRNRQGSGKPKRSHQKENYDETEHMYFGVKR
jgi:hypothetical protein